jgi:hypothetical protein
MLTRANHPALFARSDHEVAAYIALFNLALDTCGPDFVFTDQVIQEIITMFRFAAIPLPVSSICTGRSGHPLKIGEYLDLGIVLS